MCTGLEPYLAYIAAAGVVVSAAGAVYAADQTQDAADATAAQNEADAAAARGQAEVEAARIRKAVKAQQSAARAALAASGVEVATGTAEQIETDIGQRGEEDALSMILSGGNRKRYLERQAALDRYGGDQAMTAGVLTGLSSVASSSRGWRGGKQQTPAWDMSYTSRGSGD